MRAALGVDALLGQPQPLHGPAAHQVFRDNLRGVAELDVAVPDGLRVNHHCGAVLALVQTAGFVDAHLTAQPGGFGELLQLGVQFAFSVGGAGWAGRVGGAGVVADKDVAFKCGQALSLLGLRQSRWFGGRG